MRKISVLLLICILFLNICSLTIYADNNTDYSYDIEIMNKLGIMTGNDNGDFNPKDCLTRAEFAKIVCVLDGSDESTLYDLNSAYKDLSANHWAYNYICYVSDRGYMTGDDKGRFRPDDCITGNEVTKVLIHMLGYYYRVPDKGGYPTGYVATANTLGIYKGFNASTYDYILREETARLINNSLDIPIMELMTVGSNYEYNSYNGETILSRTFSMKRDKGIVLATDSASVLSNDLAPEGRVVIDGITMKTDEEFTELLGSEVTFIYSFVKNEDDMNELFCYNASESNKLTILKEQFVEFKNNALIYEISDGETKKVNVSQTASYILNGNNINYDNTVLDFELGDITFVSSSGTGSYDVVIINSAEVITAGIIDTRNNKIYDEYISNLYVDFSKYDIKYLVETGDGKTIGFSDIKQGDILTVYKGKDICKVIVNNNYVTGFVDSVDSEGFYIKDTEYKYDYYGQNRKSAAVPGNSITAYFDAYGYVANIVMSVSEENALAYLAKLGTINVDMEKKLVAKLFTKDGIFVEYPFADNITVNGVACKNKTYQQILDLITVNNSYNGVVNYKVADDKITELETAKTYEEFSDSNDGLCLKYEDRERKYFKASTSFEYEIYYNTNTVFFKVPPNPSEAAEEAFEIIASTYFYDGDAYTLSGYVDNKADIETSAVVLTGNVYPDKFEGHEVLCAVEKISTAVNSEGELIKKINILKGLYGDSKKEKELYINIHENIKDEDNNYTFNDISEGDIVKFMYDKDGRIRRFKLFYKYTNGILDDRTTDSDTNTTDVDNINRIVCSKIKNVAQGYVSCENNEVYRISDMQVIVIESRSSFTKASLGEISDLIFGEQCVVQMISKRPYTIFVFK